MYYLSVWTVENHGKNGKKHGPLLGKSQKSRQNHGRLAADLLKLM